MKKSNQACYDKYFERNWNNIKNTWKGIKFIISLNTVASSVFRSVFYIQKQKMVKKKRKLYGPFLWMGFNCLKVYVLFLQTNKNSKAVISFQSDTSKT